MSEPAVKLKASILDGFVKSPSAALRFIFRHCGVLLCTLIPQDSRALHLELLTVPSTLTTFCEAINPYFARHKSIPTIAG
jgi:hypothetical protein